MATTFDSISDDQLTTRLQALFHETVRLHIQLENAEADSARLKDELRNLESQINASHDEISRIVKELKRRTPDIGVARKATTKPASMPRQDDLMHQTIFAAARASMPG